MEETVEDRSLEFVLRSSPDAALPPLGTLRGQSFHQLHWKDAFDAEQAPLREAVWALKSQLDPIPGDVYTNTRNKLFPLAVSGGERHFSNRAGHKLLESMEATGVWMALSRKLAGKSRKRPRELIFADVCGGPGAFTQALFQDGRRQGWKLMHGYGMTLGGVEGLDWYNHLLKSKRFTCTYGLDGTGDIFQLSNIECLASLTMSVPLLLVVADGGFHVEFERANYQEPISARILFGQWLAALKLLRHGGCFVLKLFDTFSPLSRAILYLSCFLYERVHIAKPRHSRVVNSERYLVCVDYRGYPSKDWEDYLDEYYERGFTEEDHAPELLPAEWVLGDERFMADMREMNSTVVSNQMIALRMILKAVPEVAAEMAAATSEEKPDEAAGVGTEDADPAEGDEA